jgi:serine protease
MAAPHVAGVVALMQSRRIAQGRPLMTPSEVESTLRATAYPLAGTCSGGCGAGIVHARAAVDAAGAPAGGGTQTYTNGTDVAIRDHTTVESAITVSGRSGNAPSTSTVAVDIRHTWIGDLLVQLVAPDGTLYTLHNRTGTSTDNIIRSYTVNLSSEPLNGTWRLRVNDNASGDTGFINSWSLTF